jgi:protein O-mannosyl-transferase
MRRRTFTLSPAPHSLLIAFRFRRINFPLLSCFCENLVAMSKSPPVLSAPQRRPASTRLALIGLLVLLLPWGMAVFCPFIHVDDVSYISHNPHVNTGISVENIRWAFTNFYLSFYQPLTWLSFMLDASLMGTHPEGFHFVNVLFHAANTFLFFWFLRRTTGSVGRAFLAAAIFSIHPLRVESVAWATERKDVLFAFFGLLALLCYVSFVRTRRWKWYGGALLFFACSLLSKAVLMTFPLLLILIDLWPLARPFRKQWKRLLVEKIPFAALAATSICVTTYALNSTLGNISRELPLWVRLSNAMLSLAYYLRDMFYFGQLSLFYPYAPVSPSVAIAVAFFLAVLTFLIVQAAVKRPHWGRPLCVGWCWFFLTVSPMLGLVQSGLQSRADRFTYFPSMGLCVAAVWLWPDSFNAREKLLRWRNFGAATILVLLTCFCSMQLYMWQNWGRLYLSGIQRTERNWYLMARLADAYAGLGQFTLAEEYYRQSIAIESHDADTRLGYGMMLEHVGRYPEALAQYQVALQCQPDDPIIQASLRRVSSK